MEDAEVAERGLADVEDAVVEEVLRDGLTAEEKVGGLARPRDHAQVTHRVEEQGEDDGEPKPGESLHD